MEEKVTQTAGQTPQSIDDVIQSALARGKVAKYIRLTDIQSRKLIRLELEACREDCQEMVQGLLADLVRMSATNVGEAADGNRSQIVKELNGMMERCFLMGFDLRNRFPRMLHCDLVL